MRSVSKQTRNMRILSDMECSYDNVLCSLNNLRKRVNFHINSDPKLRIDLFRLDQMIHQVNLEMDYISKQKLPDEHEL